MGETVDRIKRQLNEFWQNMDKGKKLKLGISSLLILMSLTAIIYFSTRTNYEVLYSNLSLKDAGNITKKLDELGVKWENPDNDTTTILVPADLKNKIKIQLATEGLPKEGYSFIDAFNDSSWTMTDYEKKERIKYALQNELASTISFIDGIEGATVYIDIPDESNFVLNNTSSESKASVFLKLSGGRPLGPDKVTAIGNLVAGAIKGMSLENVTITDDSGKLLTGESDSGIGQYNLTEQFNIQHTLQAKIDQSIKRFLEKVFGNGNVEVRSSIQVDFNNEVTNIIQFSPPIEGNEEGLVRSMEEVEEYMVNVTDGGVPGTDTNTNDIIDYSQIENNNSEYDKASRTINYELNEINKQIQKAPGQIESITVAVLINQESIVGGELTEDKREEITNLIYAATGLDTKQVQVSSEKFNDNTINNMGSFQESSSERPFEIPLWAIALALFSVLGIAGFTVYRRKNSNKGLDRAIEEISSTSSEPIKEIDLTGNEKSEIKAQINKFVDKKPEDVAQLLRTWLNEE